MNHGGTSDRGRRTIAVLMPMVWGIRNVVHSGVLERLAGAGVDVHLLMRDYDPSLLESPEHDGFRHAASCQRLVEPPVRRRIRGRSFLRRVIHSTFARRNEIGSYALYRRWYARDDGPVQRRKARVVELLGIVAQPAPLFFRLCDLYNWLYRVEYDLGPVRSQLRQLSPDLVWSTVNVEGFFERAYVLAARDLGTPVVNAILSFDNLTSKPAHLVYDHYLVWNERMKGDLLSFYPQVGEGQVTITGTPQFDFHRRPEYLWSRRKTLEEIGLPPEARYSLYAATTASLAPAEPALVQGLVGRLEDDGGLEDHWLVVRTHPLDDWDRWRGVPEASNRAVLSPAWSVKPDENSWALPIREDQARLVSSLAHAEACLNIASTMTLDAAILDCPVIGIQFEEGSGAPEEILYQEFDADHYRPLVESGGLRIARDWPDLMDLLRRARALRRQDREARARMATEECGALDGCATERVADALIRLATTMGRARDSALPCRLGCPAQTAARTPERGSGAVTASLPTVSVVMPTYNRAGLLPKIVASILDQGFEDFELLIVDDGSADNSADVIEEIQRQDSRVRYLRLTENRGIGFAREAGRLRALGTYHALADSDDVWLPGKLERQVAVMDAYPEIDILFTDFRNVDYVRGTDHSGFSETQAGMKHLVARQLDDHLWLVEEGVEVGILRSNFVAAPTMMLRPEVFDRTGGFETSLITKVDFEFGWRAAVRGARFAYLDEPLIERYRHESSVTADVYSSQTQMLDALEICRQTCERARRPDLLDHVDAAENRVWMILIRNYAREGRRAELWRAYRSSLQNRPSLHTLLFCVLGLGGPGLLSAALELRRRIARSLSRRGLDG